VERTPSNAPHDSPCLVACALGRESRALNFPAEHWQVRFITTGMGGSTTARRLRTELENFPPSMLIFTGVAGALSPELALGQVLLPRVWALEDGRRFVGSPQLLERLETSRALLTDLGLTVRRPVLRPQSRLRLHQETGAEICDMEAARALEIAQQFGVPALSIKVVSDTAESSLADFWRDLGQNLEQLSSRLDGLFGDLGIPRRH